MNGYSIFVLTLLVVYSAVDVALLFTIWWKRNELVIRLRTPELVIISGAMSLAMAMVILLQEYYVSEYGTFTCIPGLWASYLYPPPYALPYILRSLRQLVAHRVCACMLLSSPCVCS